MDQLKRYWKIVLGVTIILVVIFGQLLQKDEEQILPSLPTSDSPGQTKEYIYVDLKGEVRYPGVYKVLSETRLFQVISQAGGLTVYADDLAINLSMKMYDQTVVYIPHIGEDFPSIHEGEYKDSAVVNINQAGLEELMSLPGIGEVTARDIIAYRNEHGGFSKIEDLMNVSGIGEATFERLKERISIS